MSNEGVTVTGAEEYPVFESFDDYDLDENLLRGIYSYGFEKPSAIQQRGIKPILDGRDTIGQAQSGTGKTATFVIGILQRIDMRVNACQALILAPTRELANQIQKVALALGDYMRVREGTRSTLACSVRQPGHSSAAWRPRAAALGRRWAALECHLDATRITHRNDPETATLRNVDVRTGLPFHTSAVDWLLSQRCDTGG